MACIHTILLAAIQALTEFLPISSSAHLLIAHRLIDNPIINSLFFDVMLHGGTLLAVIWYFKAEIAKMFQAAFSANPRGEMVFYRHLGFLTAISAIPAFFAGYFFDNIIENGLHSVNWVILPLIIGGFLFILSERICRKTDLINNLNMPKVIFIGLMQVLAFIPGVSRSGATILGGLFVGLKREEAARFAFLISLPVILGAVIKKIADLSAGDFLMEEILLSILGLIFSAVFGYAVIKYFIQFTKRFSLDVFAFYRIALAFILLFWLAKSV